MATARAESSIPLSPEAHHVPSGRVPESNLEYHSWYRGDADFSVAVRAGKLIRAKPMKEICCFLSTMYLYAAQ